MEDFLTTTSDVCGLSFAVGPVDGGAFDVFAVSALSSIAVLGLRTLRLFATGAGFFKSLASVPAGLFVRRCAFLFSGLANSNDFGLFLETAPALLGICEVGVSSDDLEADLDVTFSGVEVVDAADLDSCVFDELPGPFEGVVCPSKLKRFRDAVLEYELFERRLIIIESSIFCCFCLYT